ncbi:MAG: hypothetical protein HY735_23975 [Verrucomicrobia bacterium]|nr:hypothetical protein [Verrucomicrobiota bacterium]
MLTILSGGQTGDDRAALDFAIAHGVVPSDGHEDSEGNPLAFAVEPL